MTVIATWNINSVRLRAELVARFLSEEAPDVLCLQETKTPVEKFPHERFAALGYVHFAGRGERGYNGVAIVSRLALEPIDHRDFCGRGDARHVAARLPSGVVVHSLYVPAGGDEPKPGNAKFAHKMAFLAEMADWGASLDGPQIAVGDLNVAPLEHDVWDHAKMLKVVSHTPEEVAALTAAQTAGGWTDVTRADIAPSEKLYSWWSYRAKDWALSNRGRRLDHIWARGWAVPVAGSSQVLKDWRGCEKPSDHVPVLARFDLG
ncbi:MAG: exodeoxyribonuclease III [Pseudomonadota bacterium]